ncbi:hypothetical protein Gotri_004482 [Gossypium trilobum]|uniref:RNase H type-1 domain-containing protein n=1 Tax=Gossypium trilobum TaxID=34281 RepID=A0A7J9F715_9ROSI|nr:hypothetical protein [Gossypium trilobum]
MFGDCYQKLKGVVLGSTIIFNNHIPTGFVAEAITYLQAVRLGIDLEFQDVVMEGNSLTGNQVAYLLPTEGLRGEMNTYLLNGVPDLIEEAVEKDRWGTIGGVSLVL